jgi:hypothetical protein
MGAIDNLVKSAQLEQARETKKIREIAAEQLQVSKEQLAAQLTTNALLDALLKRFGG